MECRANMPGNAVVATFQTCYYMFKHRSGGANDFIYDAEGACEADMGAHKG